MGKHKILLHDIVLENCADGVDEGHQGTTIQLIFAEWKKMTNGTILDRCGGWSRRQRDQAP